MSHPPHNLRFLELPEYLVYNGSSQYYVAVKQQGGREVGIAPKEALPIFAVDRNKGLSLSFHYDAIGGETKSLRLEELGLHIELIKTPSGDSLGSLAIQTSIGSIDSRLLIKLGEVGEIERAKPNSVLGFLPASFLEDNFRFRIQAEKFTITLKQDVFVDQDKDGKGAIEQASLAPKNTQEPAMAKPRDEDPDNIGSFGRKKEIPICKALMSNVVYDVQKLFKSKEELAENETPERCQLSLIIGNLQIRDETPMSPCPIVFDFRGEKNNFIDFCVRTKGPWFASNVKVALCDLILAPAGVGDDEGRDKIYLQTRYVQ
jgi:hypothetical protein